MSTRKLYTQNQQQKIIALVRNIGKKLIPEYRIRINAFDDIYDNSIDIVKQGIQHFLFVKIGNDNIVRIDPSALYKDKNLSSLCTAIDVGTLTIRGTHIFTDIFQWLESNKNLLEIIN